MTTQTSTLPLVQARAKTDCALAAAAAMSVACSVAITDATGSLLSFARDDAAFPGSVEPALNKAFTALLFDVRTVVLAERTQPGEELFGIQHSHGGRVVVVGGGIPVRIDGRAMGAVGVSGNFVAQGCCETDGASLR